LKNRFKSAALAVLLTGLFSHGSAEAVETIRVAFAPDIPSVTISGSPDLVLKISDGRPFADEVGTSVEIRVGSSGLTVQGRPTGLQELIASSPGGDIHFNGLAVGGILHVLLYRDRLRLINELEVEEYLKGVVPAEVSPLWNPEALKAQAVIARTYALHQKQANLGKESDLSATTADQVYGGRAGWS